MPPTSKRKVDDHHNAVPAHDAVDDLRLSELLISRFCHDLVSPIGAITNGIELINEIGDDIRDDAIELIGGSALVAARRLAYFRLAHGAGSQQRAVPILDARQVACDLFSVGRIELDWPRYLVVPFERANNSVSRMILCALLLAEEALQRGTIELACQEDRGRLTLRLLGREPGLSEPSRAAFDGQVTPDELDPRTVHAYVTGKLIRNNGFYLTFDPISADRLDIHMGPA